jgi:hypothetical protein
MRKSLLCLLTLLVGGMPARLRAADDDLPRSSSRLQVSVSTPSEYLRGHRDDYADVWQGSVDSEYQFSLAGEDLETLHLQDESSTAWGVKPFYEAYGMQAAIVAPLPEFLTTRIPVDTSTAELAYGMRYLRLNETFTLAATGGLFDHVRMESQLHNELIGPQLAFQWSKQARGWKLQLQSWLMLGYNLTEADSTVRFRSQPLLVGAVNRPLYVSPSAWSTHQAQQDFASVGELRALLSRRLTDGVWFRCGYTGVHLTQLQQLDRVQRWSLPGLVSLEQNPPNTWVDQLHASVEWRH